jgi:hypothetical protein
MGLKKFLHKLHCLRCKGKIQYVEGMLACKICKRKIHLPESKVKTQANELPRSRADGVSAEAESSSRGFIPGASSRVFARNNKWRA